MTGYIIYYQQQNGEHTGSEMAGATATTATITGLITGGTYSITMVATSSTLPSDVTDAKTITIGTSVKKSYINVERCIGMEETPVSCIIMLITEAFFLFHMGMSVPSLHRQPPD